MLRLVGVSRHFGGVRAIDRLDLKVEAGKIVGLIGPNGSGKSTTIGVISGLIPLTAGRIDFAGRDISRLPVHQRVALGIGRTFQNSRTFNNLNVRNNLPMTVQSAVEKSGFLSRRLAARDEVEQALEIAGLTERANDLAADLSPAERRRLEWARALALNPRLLLLDEPAAGLSREELDQLKQRILDSRRRGITILLVEHILDLVMAVSDRIAVLDLGRKIEEGTPAEVCASVAARQAYLGSLCDECAAPRH
jgi:branched-chain amino acid transport system ATP-binding protein